MQNNNNNNNNKIIKEEGERMKEVKDENFKHSNYIALNSFTWDNLYRGQIILLYNE